MNISFDYNNASEALPGLLNFLLSHGEEVGSRAGRVKELTMVSTVLRQPWQREIIVANRNPSIAAQIAETMWVLAGRNDMEWLVRYLPRAAEFSDDGKRWRAGYGARLRSWEKRDGSGDVVDQLRYVVDTLRSSSLSRQAVMSIWDPVIDTAPGKDIPCNNWLSFSNRGGKLDLHVAIRSNDAIWGWSGINAFEWSALLEIVAGLVGVGVGSLHFSTTSFHVYEHHWGKAREIVKSAGYNNTSNHGDSPRFDATGFKGDLEVFDDLCESWFTVEELIREGDPMAEKFVDDFPEPMLQSWLRVLQWWWSGDRKWLIPLAGTRLDLSTSYSIQPPSRAKKKETSVSVSKFIKFACETHIEKHKAYGDSWKRRGEMLGILANVARKVDRLGKSETSDETSADTAMDLMVYLAKYRTWLEDNGRGAPTQQTQSTTLSDDPKWANRILIRLDDNFEKNYDKEEFKELDRETVEIQLQGDFDVLEQMVNEDFAERWKHVDLMIATSYLLARSLWDAEQGTDEYLGADHD